MWEKEHHISNGVNASPACPSGKSRMKMKTYEQAVRTLTVAACSKGVEILISH